MVREGEESGVAGKNVVFPVFELSSYLSVTGTYKGSGGQLSVPGEYSMRL